MNDLFSGFAYNDLASFLARIHVVPFASSLNLSPSIVIILQFLSDDRVVVGVVVVCVVVSVVVVAGF